MFEFFIESLENFKFCYVVVIEFLMTNVHLNIYNFEEEVCGTVCEPEFPRCWSHYIFSHAKVGLSNKVSHLS